MEYKVQAMLEILKMRKEIYSDLAKAKKIERDAHSIYSATYQILDNSNARLEAKEEAVQEIITELEELLAEEEIEA
jgi:Asp/Glu/hydantoin racemase